MPRLTLVKHLADHLLLQAAVHRRAARTHDRQRVAPRIVACRTCVRRRVVWGRAERARLGVGRTARRIVGSGAVHARLAQEPVGQNVLVHVECDFGHLVGTRVALKHLASHRLVGRRRAADLLAVRVALHGAVGHIQHAQVLRHKREHVGVVTLECLVKLVLARKQGLAHGASRELEDMVMPTDLVVERLQLHDIRERLRGVLDVVVVVLVWTHTPVVRQVRRRDRDGLPGRPRVRLPRRIRPHLTLLVGCIRLGVGRRTARRAAVRRRCTCISAVVHRCTIQHIAVMHHGGVAWPAHHTRTARNNQRRTLLNHGQRRRWARIGVARA
ncbi:hypothetical protein GLX27_002035 [Malassezia furfur]|uniref:Uncharacterized protein n=1 Tax=Malassezia furfur TaxID=55194 RepID=A0ABY8EPB3_MALFU|nr:hypothetical protein GLX27_002035 [Malassezia furfur]